jgi:Leucine-rich repeat (LRR) protein
LGTIICNKFKYIGCINNFYDNYRKCDIFYNFLVKYITHYELAPTNYTELKLSYNSIQTLPNEIGQIKYLQHLDLYWT